MGRTSKEKTGIHWTPSANLKMWTILRTVDYYHQNGNIYKRKLRNWQRNLGKLASELIPTIQCLWRLIYLKKLQWLWKWNVDNVNYLRSVINWRGFSDAHRNLLPMKNKRTKVAKVRIFNSNVKSMLMEGSQIWETTRCGLNKMQVLRKNPGMFCPIRFWTRNCRRECSKTRST